MFNFSSLNYFFFIYEDLMTVIDISIEKGQCFIVENSGIL